MLYSIRTISDYSPGSGGSTGKERQRIGEAIQISQIQVRNIPFNRTVSFSVTTLTFSEVIILEIGPLQVTFTFNC